MGKTSKKVFYKDVLKYGAIIGAVGVPVGLLIFSNVTTSIDQSTFTTGQNSTAAKIKDTTLDSFELGVVALIVLAAVVILSVVYMLGR